MVATNVRATIRRTGVENGPLATYECDTCDADARTLRPEILQMHRLLPITKNTATSDEIAELNVGEHAQAFPGHRMHIHRFWLHGELPLAG